MATVLSEPAARMPAEPSAGGIPYEAARRAADSWSKVPASRRGKRLLEYRRLLVDRIDELVEIAHGETGKPHFDLVSEVLNTCDLLGWVARKGPGILKRQVIRPHLLVNKRAVVYRRPHGVVACVTPWNYPITLVMAPVAQALIAGNAVLLKPSERTTGTARFLVELFGELGLDEPVVQLVEGGKEAALALASSPRIDMLTFTGGTEGGRAVAKAAAENLTPVELELGGNDAMIVAHDVHFKRAAAAAVWGAFYNAGQSCIGVERCYVHGDVIGRFLPAVLEEAAKVRLDPDDAESSDYGPLMTAGQVEKVRALLADALGKGAALKFPTDAGSVDDLFLTERLMRPAVLTGVTGDMRLMNEECFGPVLPIQVVRSADEAIALANDSRFGLSASVWCRDAKTARRIARQLHVGSVSVNDVLIHFAITELPFGGVGDSGSGRSFGAEGIRRFSRTLSIAQHQFGLKREWHWFPTKGKLPKLRTLLDSLYKAGGAADVSGHVRTLTGKVGALVGGLLPWGKSQPTDEPEREDEDDSDDLGPTYH